MSERLDPFTHLDRLLAERIPPVLESVRPGVPDAELDQFETEFGRALPDEFRALYRWHDGVDGPAPFPGLGSWLPLMSLVSACMTWQENWQFGFDPWWVPIAFDSDSAYAIDTAGGRDRPARTVFFRLDDGIVGETDSVVGMLDQIVHLVGSGALEASGGSHVGVPRPADVDPALTLFRHDRLGRAVAPDTEQEPRFRLVRRGDTPLDTDTDIEVPYQRLAATVMELATAARATLGRDQRVIGLFTADRYRPGAPEAGGANGLHGGTLAMLDAMYRGFRRNDVAPVAWADTWYDAEHLAFSIHHRSVARLRRGDRGE